MGPSRFEREGRILAHMVLHAYVSLIIDAESHLGFCKMLLGCLSDELDLVLLVSVRFAPPQATL